jgi:hypothetical protein
MRSGPVVDTHRTMFFTSTNRVIGVPFFTAGPENPVPSTLFLGDMHAQYAECGTSALSPRTMLSADIHYDNGPAG